MTTSKTPTVLAVGPLGFPWKTLDPFLFCVHHNDAYPAGNAQMGLDAAQLRGRRIGQDFSGKDGWSMYHGNPVPGFPQHPHRGFETITIARRGFIDHTDSMGAAARFGQGDVQWMTAGNGVVHSEMFPLLNTDKPNTAELFQIWLNLPAEDKRRKAHFTMFWSEEIPTKTFTDSAGKATELTVIAGAFEGVTPLSPPPASWASRPESNVSVWTLKMAPGATWTAPPTQPGTNRAFYHFVGDVLDIDGHKVPVGQMAQVKPDASVTLRAGQAEVTEVLMLQGRPIGEPVVQHGPFVMNSVAEIHQAIGDYQRTGFGGWPWPQNAPVHPREQGRFALHGNGERETPGGA